MAGSEFPGVIVDTNVLFSGLGRPLGIPARVVSAVVPQRMIVGSDLLSEYRRVLLEPRALAFLGLTEDDIEAVLSDIEAGAQIEPSSAGPTCPDPADQHLWDLLAGVPQAVLVTGERLLLSSGHFPGRIMSPREFVERHLDSGP